MRAEGYHCVVFREVPSDQMRFEQSPEGIERGRERDIQKESSRQRDCRPLKGFGILPC